MVSASGDQLQSVLPVLALEGGKFALLTRTIKFFSAPIHSDLSLGEQSIIETGHKQTRQRHGASSAGGSWASGRAL